MPDHDLITRERIIADLSTLGLDKGLTVLVHSSLSSLGRCPRRSGYRNRGAAGGAGPEGTLLMPSFQKGGEYDLLRRGGVFDLRTSPSEMGLITETFRRWPGVIRSISPHIVRQASVHRPEGFSRASDVSDLGGGGVAV